LIPFVRNAAVTTSEAQPSIASAFREEPDGLRGLAAFAWTAPVLSRLARLN
jgi:hypothetical protein